VRRGDVNMKNLMRVAKKADSVILYSF